MEFVDHDSCQLQTFSPREWHLSMIDWAVWFGDSPGFMAADGQVETDMTFAYT